MRFQRLSDLKRPAPKEITLAVLPEEIPITRFALDKAFAISDLVRGLYQESFEWYGFTLAAREDPETVTDIGLPRNDENSSEYTRLSAERIALYHEALPPGTVINGWIHSHGGLDLKKFSGMDDGNQATVLDFVTTRLRRPVAKREVAVQDLVLLVQDRFVGPSIQQLPLIPSILCISSGTMTLPATMRSITRKAASGTCHK